jgi:dTDP-4-dehydrorhamnose 3,5-epimerase
MAEVKESATIRGVYHVSWTAHGDTRGRFAETYRREWFPTGREMVQGNRSESIGNVLRGMHYHFNQADYWIALKGRVFVALFDARKGSPTEGKTECFEMGEVLPGGADDAGRSRDRGVYIPPGVAHGFLTLSDCLITYLVEAYYDAKDELGIMWNDPAMNIPWPSQAPILSGRDQKNPLYSQLADAVRPVFGTTK